MQMGEADIDIIVCDVGPRDGLQNEMTVLAPAVRAELIEKLADVGLPRVEAASFVNPKLVPAMAGAEEVVTAIGRRDGVTYSAPVLNERGYTRALEAGVDGFRFGFSATDEFGQRNQNQTTGEGLKSRGRWYGAAMTMATGSV